MNRREFLGAAALATAATVIGKDCANSSAQCSRTAFSTFPVLKGPEFQGMEGAIVPIFTPYTKDDKVNGDMVGRMVEHLLKQGVAGFYVGGGTGEHVLLTLDERKYLAEAAIRATNGRAKVIIHVGCTYTEDSVRLAKHAEKTGADWIASLGPLVFGQNFDASCYHYSRIAGATALPMMIYCWYRDLVPERERKFYDIPNLKGLKYTGTNFWSVQEMRRMIDKEILCFVGDDPHLLGGLTMDGIFSGGIGTTYNIIPRSYVEICRLAKEGKFAEAAPIQSQANRITYLLSESSNFSYRKAAMRFLGFDCGFARSPFGRPITEAEYTAFAKKLEAALADVRFAT